MGRHPNEVRDQFIKWLNCQHVLFLQSSIIQTNKRHQTRVNSRTGCLPLVEKLPPHLILLLISQIHFPYTCGTVSGETNSCIWFIARKHCYNKKESTKHKLYYFLCWVYVCMYALCTSPPLQCPIWSKQHTNTVPHIEIFHIYKCDVTFSVCICSSRCQHTSPVDNSQQTLYLELCSSHS